MMTFAKLKQYIGEKIDAATSINVHGTKPPSDAVFPYCVYKLKNINNDDINKERWLLEIDYWNKSLLNEDEIDSTAVLTAVEAVKLVMHKGWQVETDGFFRSFLDFADEIPDDTPGIYRFNQRFTIDLR